MSEIDFEAIWSALPIPAILVGSDLSVKGLNPAAESFVALSTKRIVGQPLAKFVGEASRILDVVEQVIERSSSLVQYDV